MEGDGEMIVMDLKMDNFLSFNNFHMNMSYPKKIINSCIDSEFLKERVNFRYKKVNIIMGGNATGKTSVGRILMSIFNFIYKDRIEGLFEKICDDTKTAKFSIDFIVSDYILYRVRVEISPKQSEQYNSTDVKLRVESVAISKADSYESCIEKFDDKPLEKETTQYIDELKKIEPLTWFFTYTDSEKQFDGEYENYTAILNNTLKALDPSIIKVEKLEEVENTYVIRMKNQSIVIQDGEIVKDNILSSGTQAGINIAYMVSAIKEGGYSFYYCDEQFSYIHSDIEKAFLSIMIDSIPPDGQLFFTTHNLDVLDLLLPKHSFNFLKKDDDDINEPIKIVNASKYLKRNTDSLRNAVDNDLFAISPNVELINEIVEL